MLNFRCGQIFSSRRAANIHSTKKHGAIQYTGVNSIRRDNVEDLEYSDDGMESFLLKSINYFLDAKSVDFFINAIP